MRCEDSAAHVPRRSVHASRRGSDEVHADEIRARIWLVPSGHELLNEALLEYDGINGIRSACHLLVYGRGADPLVCIAGNFDVGLGSPTTNAIEVVATAIASRVSPDTFRLFEWYSHNSGRPFSEVTLSRIPPERIAWGTAAIGSGTDAHTIRRDTAVVRFADPHWSRRAEDDVADLLGETRTAIVCRPRRRGHPSAFGGATGKSRLVASRKRARRRSPTARRRECNRAGTTPAATMAWLRSRHPDRLASPDARTKQSRHQVRATGAFRGVAQ